jgi:hypothetical protein
MLIALCTRVVMAAAGLVKVQFSAKNKLRNMRRAQRGLPPLEPGEDSEDDEILNKSDFEAYQQLHPPPAGEALQFLLEGQKGPSGCGAPALMESGTTV